MNKSKSSTRLFNCQSEAEFIDKQLQKKSRVLSSHLCRRPLNVIIQRSSTNLANGDKKHEKNDAVPDTDLFMTKLGIDEYNFADDLLDGEDEEIIDDDLNSEDELEAEKQQKLLSQLNKNSMKVGEDLFKASDEVRDQLADIRVLKQFVKQQREQIAEDNMTRMYVGRS